MQEEIVLNKVERQLKVTLFSVDISVDINQHRFLQTDRHLLLILSYSVV